MKKALGIVMGILLIAAGVIFALNSLGITQFEVSFDGWWTLFIIVPGICGLFTGKDKIGNLIIVSIGIYLLLAAQNIIEYGMFWKLFIPTVIILLGIKLILKTIKGEDESTTDSEVTDEKAECMAAFDSKTADYSGKDIKIAKVGALFGGTKCNLSDANFHDGGSIDVFCMFGGADIIVPENVEIKINAFCLFGGISDKRNIKSSTEKNAKLTVNGFCLFGGADIK